MSRMRTAGANRSNASSHSLHRAAGPEGEGGREKRGPVAAEAALLLTVCSPGVLGRFEEAHEQARPAVSLAPGNPDARAALEQTANVLARPDTNPTAGRNQMILAGFLRRRTE